MSAKMLPTPTLTTVCDLCLKPITEQHHGDVYGLLTSSGGRPPGYVVTERTHLRFWRGWADRLGVRSGATQGVDVSLDFHGECLLGLIRSAMTGKEVAR